MSKDAPGVRYGEMDRETNETRVQVVMDIDGGTRQDINTGIGFFDHMLTQFAFHGQFDLGVICEGDLLVDDHHSVEDVGIVLGEVLGRCLDDDSPIARYGSIAAPMDESLALVAVDISGRGEAHVIAKFDRDRVGGLSTECVKEFVKALATHAGITIHVQLLAGDNDHHKCEAIFKGLGLAIHQASRRIERRGSSSTKGKRD